jgi:hypothetical protein
VNSWKIIHPIKFILNIPCLWGSFLHSKLLCCGSKCCVFAKQGFNICWMVIIDNNSDNNNESKFKTQDEALFITNNLRTKRFKLLFNVNAFFPPKTWPQMKDFIVILVFWSHHGLTPPFTIKLWLLLLSPFFLLRIIAFN